MSVNPLSSSLVNLLSTDSITTKSNSLSDESGGSFADILTESLKTAQETDAADKTSALELLTGQSDDMSGMLLDATKAELSLSLSIQIRNKVVESYNEIMRMQV